MEHINRQTLQGLLVLYAEDQEALDMIHDALQSFMDYYTAIYRAETQMRVYSCKSMSPEAYRDKVSALDGLRTKAHNAVIARVSMLNRMAESAKLPPFYPGEVSEQRPFRRYVANAVLDFCHQMILERQ